jgi:RNA polymerase sigma-70 factor (ECF subfamily)
MSTTEFTKELIGLRQSLQYFALHLTRNDEAAQDLLQDTFMKAITYKDKFVEKTNLKAWCYTIMKNTFINNYRRAVKANTIIDTTEDLYFLNLSKHSDDTAPEGIYATNEIQKTINNLEDEYRIPFMMHHTGYKYKEIADHLDLPIGTVKSRIFLARKKLMEILKDYRR